MEYTEESPCRRCDKKGLDKNECCNICERLDAYQDGLPYDHLPYPGQKKEVAPLKKIIKRYAECLMPGCHRAGTYMGLCHRCYQRWRAGKILHPKYGKWRNGLRTSTKGISYQAGNNRLDWKEILKQYNKKYNKKIRTIKSLITQIYKEKGTIPLAAEVLLISHHAYLNKMIELDVPRGKKGHRGDPAILQKIKDIGDTSNMNCSEIARRVKYSKPYVWRICKERNIAYKKTKGGM